MTSTAAPDILLEICARRRERLGVSAGAFEVAGGAAGDVDAAGSQGANALCRSLDAKRGEAVIAEVKLGSPKLGSLVGTFDPEEQARAYAAAGAAALSVVVEPDFFWGSYDILARCREASGLPAIAKDFVVSLRQLELASEAGASAVLLIAALYDAETLATYARLAREHGLVPLVETHGMDDMRKLGESSWELVGVNNRDLRTFTVDLDHSITMLPELPASALKVAESGIHGRDDIVKLQQAGFDAFLIGEALVKSGDPATKLAGLLGRSG
ncbi:MAG: indole-3-glycerol phosphate synthase TrpC [Acidobacteriota bacterium]|nr:indole-3-glycerol phosphate synthase TrpC [Acidobacteriota bacterium]